MKVTTTTVDVKEHVAMLMLTARTRTYLVTDGVV